MTFPPVFTGSIGNVFLPGIVMSEELQVCVFLCAISRFFVQILSTFGDGDKMPTTPAFQAEMCQAKSQGEEEDEKMLPS